MKIYVVGGSGSGKTTFSKEMAKRYSIPHLDIDTVRWINDTGKRYVRSYTVEERIELISDFITKNPEWICDGVYYHDWINGILDNVDFVIFLNVWRWRRNYRCVKRAFREQPLRTLSWRSLWKMLCWNHKYDTHYWPILKEKLDTRGIPYRIINAKSVRKLDLADCIKQNNCHTR